MTAPVPHRFCAAIALSLAVIVGSNSSYAQNAEPFYKGKTITIVTSTGPGGPYDLAAREIAKFLPRYIPGSPNFIVVNMPGGGNVLATNYLYNNAPKDGTVIATVVNSAVLHQIIDGRGVRYDARRFNWIGSTGISNIATVAWRASGVTSMDDVMRREVVTGATGTGSGTYLYPTMMNLVLGAKFNVVLGYATGAEIDLAMARGEVSVRSGQSIAGYFQEHADWMRDSKLVVLNQIGAERDALIPDVPLMTELATSDEDQRTLQLVSAPVALGRPYMAPPQTPADRVAVLRDAFDAGMRDRDFRAEAASMQLDLNPITGARVATIVDQTIDTPAPLVARAKAALAP